MAENGEGAATAQAGGPTETPDIIKAKSEHRQAMVRLEQQHEIELQRGFADLPFSVRIYFDPTTFRQMEGIANMLASSGVVAKHLRGNPAACMDCVDRALAWRQSPWFVARNQYQVHNTTGYYGALIIAALNTSGVFDEPLEFEHFAEGEGASWDRVLNKFEMRKSKRTDAEGTALEYAVPTYTDADERGLGVIVRGTFAKSGKTREFKFYLRQARPRNSVLWATDPKTQVCYTAARRFGNLVCPHVLGGVLLADEIGDAEPVMRDITPPREPAEAAPPVAEGMTPQRAGPPRARQEPRAAQPEPSEPDPIVVAGHPYQKPGSAMNRLKDVIAGLDPDTDADQCAEIELALRKLKALGRDVSALERQYQSLFEAPADDGNGAAETDDGAAEDEGEPGEDEEDGDGDQDDGRQGSLAGWDE